VRNSESYPTSLWNIDGFTQVPELMVGGALFLYQYIADKSPYDLYSVGYFYYLLQRNTLSQNLSDKLDEMVMQG
jgi:hypothetical protein